MKIKGSSGFTLIEMAIVLVIIGLILAAVMKGKDMIRSTQAKEFTEGFVYKWVNMVQSYRDKSFQVLTDGILNGGVNSTNDGYMDNVYPGQDNSTTGTLGGKWNIIPGIKIVEAMQKYGIDPCRMVKSDIVSNSTSTVTYCNGMDVFARTVKGENRVSDTRVYFANLYKVKLADGTYYVRKNALIFPNIPVDVAKAIDKQLDGRPDGKSGVVLCLPYDRASYQYRYNADLHTSVFTTQKVDAGDWGDENDQKYGYLVVMAIVLEQ